MSSMGVAPSNTLSPNTAKTRSQQDHWLCELSLVAPALPCPAPPCRGGAGRGAAPADGRRGHGGQDSAARPSRVTRWDRCGRTTGGKCGVGMSQRTERRDPRPRAGLAVSGTAWCYRGAQSLGRRRGTAQKQAFWTPLTPAIPP